MVTSYVEEGSEIPHFVQDDKGERNSNWRAAGMCKRGFLSTAQADKGGIGGGGVGRLCNGNSNPIS